MTERDLQRIRASSGWRERRVEVLHGTSEGSVIVKGWRAPRPVWRYRLLNGVARLARLPLLKAAPVYGGARAQAVEVRRLRRLAENGVAVPRLLHVDRDFFVESWLGGASLDKLLQQDDALVWWQRGLRALVDVHARGEYLSQAFARNFIGVGDTLAMIDFEDDPLEVMTLDEAQARDWLAYGHATAMAFRRCPPSLHAGLVEGLRDALVRERAEVRERVVDTARRLRWVLRLPAGRGRGWRRHILILQLAVGWVLAACVSDPQPADDNPEVSHARHH
jgi:tRNA A-37 threonylcarbamoyl transferase component Bud32